MASIYSSGLKRVPNRPKGRNIRTNRSGVLRNFSAKFTQKFYHLARAFVLPSRIRSAESLPEPSASGPDGTD